MKPVMVGIVGGSGSGKTTLANGLALLTGRYGSRVISQDHYYRGVPSGRDPETVNFDEPEALDLDLLARHLQAAGRGDEFLMPLYDFSTHCRLARNERVVPVPLMIVEGLFLYSSAPLREAFDLRFFVDVPVGERLRRRIARDTVERERVVEDIVRQFEQQVEPMYERHIAPTRRYADYVLDLPHPDDRVYCEHTLEMWRRVEQLLRGRGFPLKPGDVDTGT